MAMLSVVYVQVWSFLPGVKFLCCLLARGWYHGTKYQETMGYIIQLIQAWWTNIFPGFLYYILNIYLVYGTMVVWLSESSSSSTMDKVSCVLIFRNWT